MDVPRPCISEKISESDSDHPGRALASKKVQVCVSASRTGSATGLQVTAHCQWRRLGPYTETAAATTSHSHLSSILRLATLADQLDCKATVPAFSAPSEHGIHKDLADPPTSMGPVPSVEAAP